MNDTCICENVPKVWRLTGVTRTLRLRIFNPDGTPLDLTGREVAVTIARDNSEFVYAPGFVIEGDDHNVVKFEWPADQQGAGDYTINVTTTDGSGNVDRVNWHGPTGIRLVDFSFMVRGEDALGVTSEANIGLDGTFTMNGVGMSAYDEWLAEGHTGTPEDFIAWLRQPAVDAATEAAADHQRAETDHTTATGDHTRAEEDHAQAVTDSQQAATDHQQAESDAAAAASDREKAATDRTKAAQDRTQAASDHQQASADHGVATADHSTAQGDHTRAGQDHAQAVADSEQAASDHTRAGGDHDTAVADHQHAEADHTRAEQDHTTAAADHTTAAADHTQATADHAVMAGYDTRLGNVEGEVSQLGQEADEKLDRELADGTLYITDASRNIIAQIDASGVSTIDVKVKIDGELVSVKSLLSTLSGSVSTEQARAEAEEEKKLDHTLADNKFIITDADGNIIVKVDNDGIHSAMSKHAVACMVFGEYYYPTSAPTRDENGNITHAEVMFGTGVAGSVDITYSGVNAVQVLAYYGDYTYTVTIQRDENGNVELVTVN